MIEWTDVKIALPPEKNCTYLVCYVFNNKHVGECNNNLKVSYALWEEKSRKYKGNKWGWRSREKVRRENIKFWMPWPKPPMDKYD